MSTKAKPSARTFEESPWSGDTVEADCRNVTLKVTNEHLDQGRWSRFVDPVSLAVSEALGENACAELFWNSDSFRPNGSDDEARLGIHVEIHDPDTGSWREDSFWQPLPRRAEAVMKRLGQQGISGFQPFSMRIPVPVSALPQPAAVQEPLAV